MKQTVYIVTGASSDVGIAFLNELEKQKCENEENIKVICQYNLHGQELNELQKKFKNVELILYKCDLSSVEETQRWIMQLKEEGVDPSHILHLPAGHFQYIRLKQFNWERVVLELNIQVHCFAQLMKTFLPGMVKKKYGKIAVMLTAATVGVPPKYLTEYITEKYALLGLMKSIAAEYGGKGVTINGLSPNMIETKFLSGIDERIIEMNAQESAMNRNINMQEVVGGLKFLLSDDSNYMNGVNLNMSGGDKMF